MKNKFLVALFVALIHSPTHAVDVCDTNGGEDAYGAFDDFQQLEQVLAAPKIHTRYELADSCDYNLTTTVDINYSGTLVSLIEKLTDPTVNFASADKDKVTKYEVKATGTNRWEQNVTAKKSGVSSTVKSSCSYTEKSAAVYKFSCSMTQAKYATRANSSIRCTEGTEANWKRCVFYADGKFTGAGGFMGPGPCQMARAGSAEMVLSVLRLTEYVTFGQPNGQKWSTPGAKFYSGMDGYSKSELKNKNFVYTQQIQ